MQHRSTTWTFCCKTLRESGIWSFEKLIKISDQYMFSRGWQEVVESRCLATRGFDHLIKIWSSSVKESVQDMVTRQSIWSRSTQSRLRRGGGAAMSDWCSATSKAAIHLEREAIGQEWSRLVMIGHDWSRLVTICQDLSGFNNYWLVQISQNYLRSVKIGHYRPRLVKKYFWVSLLDKELPAGEGHHPAKKRLLLCSDLSDQVSASVIEINNLKDQVIIISQQLLVWLPTSSFFEMKVILRL